MEANSQGIANETLFGFNMTDPQAREWAKLYGQGPFQGTVIRGQRGEEYVSLKKGNKPLPLGGAENLINSQFVKRWTARP